MIDFKQFDEVRSEYSKGAHDDDGEAFKHAQGIGSKAHDHSTDPVTKTRIVSYKKTDGSVHHEVKQTHGKSYEVTASTHSSKEDALKAQSEIEKKHGLKEATALDKFRAAAAEREREANKREAEMKARHAAGKEDMKGAINTLASRFNKEEVELDESDEAWAQSKEKEKEKHLTPQDRQTMSKLRAMMAKEKKPAQREEVAANNVGDGNIAGTQGDAGKAAVMTKQPLRRKKLTDFKEWVELDEAAIDAKGYKSSTGGMTQKGVDAFRKENPGSKLQTAVTTKPSKLKPGSKAANRRKSFCARMSGVDGPMKDEKGRPTRKALALRKWNC